MKIIPYLMAIAIAWAPVAHSQTTLVKTSNGELEGTLETSGVRSFKGIPYAQPPIGHLRFCDPQPVKSWKGIRKATAFGPRAMQLPIYSDMQFRSNGMSEDCLYLNVWTAAKSASERLPVLVYFYGGGFMAGDGSEYRYDGESLARRGLVTVTVNYRLGVFGFLAHPDLTKESPHHASGNYGLMDQHAALLWVQKNIAAFGGDPTRVTIGGESAGSTSVNAQMASPLSKGLFIGAIGESGTVLSFSKPYLLADAEKDGLNFAAGLGNRSLADLRALPAEQLLAATEKVRFPITVDGYFFPKPPLDIFMTGEQMKVPLLAGWNSGESNYRAILVRDSPTVENYEHAVSKLYGDNTDKILKLYKASTPEEVKQVASDLALDRGIAFRTWKWADLQTQTGTPVYLYLYTRLRPAKTGETAPSGPPATGAGHSWEIEYALGNLPTNKVYTWTPEDYKVSETMESYFANFIRTGNPNGAGLPEWKPMKKEDPQLMEIDVISHGGAPRVDRYRLLNSLN